MEVTDMKWTDQQFATIIDGTATDVMVAVCSYSLLLNESSTRVIVEKDGAPLKTAAGYNPPYEVGRKGDVVEYEIECDITVRSRRDEGLVSCVIESNFSHRKPRKSIYLYVAVVASGEETPPLHTGMTIRRDTCLLKYGQQTLWSDPPMEAQCGLWQRNTTDSDENAGNWLPSSKQLKTVYSTENSDWQFIKYPVKNHLLSSTRSYRLSAYFKMAELPKDKMIELRCRYYRKFGKGKFQLTVELGTEFKRIMDDFRYRCPALANSTSEHGNVTAFFNEDYAADCMGMWSSYTEIKGLITCDRGNQSETGKIMCRNFRWINRRADGNPFEIDTFIDRCHSAGASVALNLFLGCVAVVAAVISN